MSGPVRVSIPMSQVASNFHELDPAVVRDELLRRVENEVVMAASVERCLQYVCVGTYQTARPSAADDAPERDRVIAAAFRAFGDRPEVVARFQAGEAVLDVDGAARRCAILLEHRPRDGAPDAWRLAWRPFGVDALGAGVLHGPWREQEGDDLDALGFPLRAWLEAGTARIESADFQPVPTVQPSVRMAVGELPPQVPVPLDAATLAAIAGNSTDKAFKERYPGVTSVFAVTGRAFELWEIEGLIAAALDDLVRLIAQRAGADGVALTFATPIDLDGELRRGWLVIAEAGGDRIHRIVTVRPGAAGGLTFDGPFFHRMPFDGMTWLGVAPTGTVELTGILGVEDAAGNPVPVAEA